MPKFLAQFDPFDPPPPKKKKKKKKKTKAINIILKFLSALFNLENLKKKPTSRSRAMRMRNFSARFGPFDPQRNLIMLVCSIISIYSQKFKF